MNPQLILVIFLSLAFLIISSIVFYLFKNSQKKSKTTRVLTLREKYLISKGLDLKTIDEIYSYENKIPLLILLSLIIPIILSNVILTEIYIFFIKHTFSYKFMSIDPLIALSIISIFLGIIVVNYVLIYYSNTLFKKYKEKYLFLSFSRNINNKKNFDEAKYTKMDKKITQTVSRYKRRPTFLIINTLGLIFYITCVILSFNYYRLYKENELIENSFFSFSEKSYKYSDLKTITIGYLKDKQDNSKRYYIKLGFNSDIITDSLGTDLKYNPLMSFIKGIADHNKIKIKYIE